MRWSPPLLAVLLVASAGCGAPPVASSVRAPPPIETISPPSAAAAPPPIAKTPSPSTPSPTPPAASAASAPPYPQEWIDEAELDNANGDCRHIVYKRGCSELRRGEVVVEFTLEPDGTVQRVEEIENTVQPDREIMSTCVRTKFPKWLFHPPEGASPTFRRRLVLADKC